VLQFGGYGGCRWTGFRDLPQVTHSHRSVGQGELVDKSFEAENNTIRRSVKSKAVA